LSQLSFNPMNRKRIMNMSYVATLWLWNARYHLMWRILFSLISGWTQRVAIIILIMPRRRVLFLHTISSLFINLYDRMSFNFNSSSSSRCSSYHLNAISLIFLYFVPLCLSLSCASVLSDTSHRWICAAWQLCHPKVPGALVCGRFHRCWGLDRWGECGNHTSSTWRIHG